MLSEQQIEALAEGTSEDAARVLAEAEATPDNVVEIKAVPPPPPEKTDDEKLREKQEQENKAINDAFKDAKELPFSAKELGKLALKRFMERAPLWIDNAERQVRQAVALGADACEVSTMGIKNYHELISNHLADAGFVIDEKEVGTEKSSIVVTLYL